jgi:hypothetical protein
MERSSSWRIPPKRRGLPFRKVNCRGSPGYDPELQRPHLLPRQLLGMGCFSALLDAIGKASVGYDDFRRNGLLLPTRESAALSLGFPLHRGPHRHYNAMVIERFGQIEASFARLCAVSPGAAREEAQFRIALLQRGLRHRLLKPRNKAFRLNRRDPLGTGFDFADLDAMAERLWSATQPEILASKASLAD